MRPAAADESDGLGAKEVKSRRRQKKSSTVAYNNHSTLTCDNVPAVLRVFTFFAPGFSPFAGLFLLLLLLLVSASEECSATAAACNIALAEFFIGRERGWEWVERCHEDVRGKGPKKKKKKDSATLPKKKTQKHCISFFIMRIPNFFEAKGEKKQGPIEEKQWLAHRAQCSNPSALVGCAATSMHSRDPLATADHAMQRVAIAPERKKIAKKAPFEATRIEECNVESALLEAQPAIIATIDVRWWWMQHNHPSSPKLKLTCCEIFNCVHRGLAQRQGTCLLYFHIYVMSNLICGAGWWC